MKSETKLDSLSTEETEQGKELRLSKSARSVRQCDFCRAFGINPSETDPMHCTHWSVSIETKLSLTCRKGLGKGHSNGHGRLGHNVVCIQQTFQS